MDCLVTQQRPMQIDSLGTGLYSGNITILIIVLTETTRNDHQDQL